MGKYNISEQDLEQAKGGFNSALSEKRKRLGKGGTARMKTLKQVENILKIMNWNNEGFSKREIKNKKRMR